jgi:Protein kinase domain
MSLTSASVSCLPSPSGAELFAADSAGVQGMGRLSPRHMIVKQGGEAAAAGERHRGAAPSHDWLRLQREKLGCKHDLDDYDRSLEAIAARPHAAEQQAQQAVVEQLCSYVRTLNNASQAELRAEDFCSNVVGELQTLAREQRAFEARCRHRQMSEAAAAVALAHANGADEERAAAMAIEVPANALGASVVRTHVTRLMLVVARMARFNQWSAEHEEREQHERQWRHDNASRPRLTPAVLASAKNEWSWYKTATPMPAPAVAAAADGASMTGLRHSMQQPMMPGGARTLGLGARRAAQQQQQQQRGHAAVASPPSSRRRLRFGGAKRGDKSGATSSSSSSGLSKSTGHLGSDSSDALAQCESLTTSASDNLVGGGASDDVDDDDESSVDMDEVESVLRVIHESDESSNGDDEAIEAVSAVRSAERVSSKDSECSSTPLALSAPARDALASSESSPKRSSRGSSGKRSRHGAKRVKMPVPALDLSAAAANKKVASTDDDRSGRSPASPLSSSKPSTSDTPGSTASPLTTPSTTPTSTSPTFGWSSPPAERLRIDNAPIVFGAVEPEVAADQDVEGDDDNVDVDDDDTELLCRICEQPISAELFLRHTTLCCAIVRCEQYRWQADDCDNALLEVEGKIKRKVRKLKQQRDEASSSGWSSRAALSEIRARRRVLRGVHKAVRMALDTDLVDIDAMSMITTARKRLADALHNGGMPLPSHTIAALGSSIEAVLDDKCAAFRFIQENESMIEQSGALLQAPAWLEREPTIDDFEVLKPISKGAYGRVFLVRKVSTGDLFALKVMNKAEQKIDNVTAERNILARINNPFVVKLYYSFQSDDKLFLVMEYLNGGDVSSMLCSLFALDGETTQQYMAELVLALEYLHAQGITHRDCKPESMFAKGKGSQCECNQLTVFL